MKTNMKLAAMLLTAVFFADVSAGQDTDIGQSVSADGKKTVKLAAGKVRMRCTVCRGRGELKVSPPDIGQYEGLITNRSHWDVKLDPCPICGKGNGRRVVWDLSHPEPCEEPPCTTCGWSGLVQCRKCLVSGLVKCGNRDCRDGWILPSRYKHSRRGNQKIKPSEVKPCPECRGVGKVLCPECRGMRANLCRKCHGLGRKMR